MGQRNQGRRSEIHMLHLPPPRRILNVRHRTKRLRHHGRNPFRRDILKELADECQKQGIALHLYYSHIDWTRDDYPQGRTGHDTGRDPSKADWDSYYGFMNRQLTELLTNYGPIRAIWFDGWWDHDEDATPFDWQLPAQYEMIHRLQPSCMVANNHHQTPFPGEDIQIFERDLPGENTAGLSGQEVSRLPLETCNTMNGMWGYKIKDQNYKDTKTLIQYLVKAAGMGANLLLNIGPQPSGELPATALSRLKEMGNGSRQTARQSTPRKPAPSRLNPGNLHEEGRQTLPSCHDPGNRRHRNPRKRQNQKAKEFISGKPLKTAKAGRHDVVLLPELPDSRDFIIECEI